MAGGFRRVVAVAGVAGLVIACAATVGRPIVVPGKAYRVVPPPGWERIDTDADVALRQPATEAGLMANGTCGGKIPHRTLPVLARHLRFGLREVQKLDEAPVEMAGLRGVRSRFTAQLDGMPVSVGAVTLQGRGCVYDLVVVAPPERLPVVAEDFERFAASFQLTEEHR
jgi:hypothetical protein